MRHVWAVPHRTQVPLDPTFKVREQPLVLRPSDRPDIPPPALLVLELDQLEEIVLSQPATLLGVRVRSGERERSHPPGEAEFEVALPEGDDVPGPARVVGEEEEPPPVGGQGRVAGPRPVLLERPEQVQRLTLVRFHP